MPEPQTLLQMAGAPAEPAPLVDSVVVMIDCQREYVDGRLPLYNVEAALAEGGRLLAKARAAGAPVVHVQHRGRPGGGLFDPDGPGYPICDAVGPAPDEPVVAKSLPNAFAGTELGEVLKGLGRTNLVVGGFMSHMCVSSTVRAGLDHGYRCAVVDAAVTTRDLPDGRGGVVDAATLHRAALVGLSDRFAVIVPDSSVF